MKKIKLLLFALVAFAGIHAKSQTADEIVNKYVDAIGGKEKIASLKTVKMTGSMSVQGADISITMTKSHLVGARTDIEVMGSSNYQVVNAAKGWIFMPVRGMDAPKEMDADEYKAYAAQMDIQGALFNYKEKGTTVELVGTEKLESGEAYNLKVTFKNGRVGNYYIDKATNHLVKVTGKAPGQDAQIATTYSDFKQNEGGYWFPYTITNPQGAITIEKIETNIPVDEKIFSN